MWSHERQAKILEELSASGKVHTNRLADLLAVSRETIRRDLLELEENGSLNRVHGGALPMARDIHPEPAFTERLSAYADVKRAIGKLGASLIPPGSTLFIDAGTTTLAFARELSTDQDHRIITNSIEIAQLLSARKDNKTLLLGGTPHCDVPCTYGELTLSEIDRFLADIAIISPVAYHSVRGASSYELHEAEVARTMIRNSRRCIMLCHSEKVGEESRVTICRPEEIDVLITDSDVLSGLSLSRGEVHIAQV